jgi:hypothetical protein
MDKIFSHKVNQKTNKMTCRIRLLKPTNKI